MNKKPNMFEALKRHIEAVTSVFCLTILPVIAGMLFIWQIFLSPEIHAYAQNLTAQIQDQLDTQVSSVRLLNEAHKRAISDKLDKLSH